MKLNTRQLQQEDLDTIRKWWEAWPDWVDPGEGFLPKTGLVVTSNDKLIMASFVYLTNADVALYEWIISDPDYREEDRQEAIELMTIEAEKIFIATGRKSNADLLKIGNTDINIDDRNFIKVNEYLETSVKKG